jgi:hypothetical protein
MCSIQDLINYLEIDSSKIPEEYLNVYSKTSIQYTIRALFTGYEPILNLSDYEDKYDILFKVYSETAVYFLESYVYQGKLNDLFFEKYKKYIDKIYYQISSLNTLKQNTISTFVRYEYYHKQPDILFRFLCFLISKNMCNEFESVFTKYSYSLSKKTINSLCEYSLLLGRIYALRVILEYEIVSSNPFKLKHMNFYIENNNFSKLFQQINYEICFSLVESRGYKFKTKYINNWIHYSKKNMIGFLYPTVEFLLSKLFKERPSVNELIDKFSLYVKSKDLMNIILNNYDCKELLSRLRASRY